MTRRPTSSTKARLGGAVVAVVVALTVPAGVLAKPPSAAPAVSVAIDVSTRSCQTVTIAYRVEWHSMTPDDAAEPATIELLATPGEYFLTSAAVDFGHKSDKAKGKVRGDLVRESGYFDHQTYPGLAYQIVVRVDGMAAQSDPIAIPECIPMSPTTGPAAGGTVVTLVGGGTFGGPPFTTDTRVTVGDAAGISPVGVASDGSWLQFVAPPGAAATCATVFTDDPGLPFPLPAFCYTG
jgi:hypothetical protein